VPDVIHLLSDHIANQIAAGEVIQRPASAVKELLENSIDAGATEIQLIVRDSGKELIQVTDNGKGMSPTDARMSFERHATSKIRNIDDLFTIRTMGFRGEALASIAAVAQVEMKTRQNDESVTMGTRIVIESTEVKLQEPCAMNPGTNLMVKNLFYNVPARRNFLKSGTTEYRNILDEFNRIALAHPGIAFRLWHNGTEQFHLDVGSLKTRIVALLGNHMEKKLVPVTQQTDVIDIHGFIGKPETATKTRGNQYFFINNRFIRNSYLNHAVTNAYDNLIEKEHFPFYVLFIDVNPAKVDVNVHPTKQEVKFDDDKLIYAYLQAAVKHALARNNIAPALDFTLSKEIQHLPAVQKPVTEDDYEKNKEGYLFSVFSDRNQAHVIEKKDSLRNWKSLYEIALQSVPGEPEKTENAFYGPVVQASLLPNTDSIPAGNNSLLIHGTYIITTIKSGMMLVHVGRARERIIYERYLDECAGKKATCQQLLFPESYDFPPLDTAMLTELIPDLFAAGIDVRHLGGNTFVVNGLPPGLQPGVARGLIDEILENLKHESSNVLTRRTELIIAGLAKRAGQSNQLLSTQEQQQALIDELFACSQSEYTPDGKKVFILLRKDTIEDWFG